MLEIARVDGWKRKRKIHKGEISSENGNRASKEGRETESISKSARPLVVSSAHDQNLRSKDKLTLVISIILISVQILGLSSVTTVMAGREFEPNASSNSISLSLSSSSPLVNSQEQRIVGSSTSNEPLHSSQDLKPPTRTEDKAVRSQRRKRTNAARRKRATLESSLYLSAHTSQRLEGWSRV